MAQAVTLNAMFTSLVSRAFRADFVEAYERNMRYGMRAQAQCRATLETLAAIKNPPTVFARQANIANGPQQVNNSTAVVQEGSRVRAIPEKPPIELLEAHVERVDAGAQATAVGGDQALEAAGPLVGSTAVSARARGRLRGWRAAGGRAGCTANRESLDDAFEAENVHWARSH